MQVIKKHNIAETLYQDCGTGIVNYDDLENDMLYQRSIKQTVLYDNFTLPITDTINFRFSYRKEEVGDTVAHIYEYNYQCTESGVYTVHLNSALAPCIFDDNLNLPYYFEFYCDTDPYRTGVANISFEHVTNLDKDYFAENVEDTGYVVCKQGYHLYFLLVYRLLKSKNTNWEVYSPTALLTGVQDIGAAPGSTTNPPVHDWSRIRITLSRAN